VVASGEFKQLPLGLADLGRVSLTAREIALVFQLFNARHVNSGGVVEALIGLDTRNAPVMMVLVMTSVTSMTAVAAVTAVTSVSAVVVSMVMSVVTSMTPVTSVMMVGFG